MIRPAPKPIASCLQSLKAAATRAERRSMRQYLHMHALCEDCRAAYATQVHHVQPKRMGGTASAWTRRSFDNYAALCLRCHEARHGR